MTQDDLGRWLRLLEGTSACEIEHDDGRTRIRLVRQVHRHTSLATTGIPIATVLPPTGATPMEVVAGKARSVRHCISAGLVGTFYRSPSPDQAPFVRVGDIVQEGQTLAIIEAMKLLNSIDADRAGRIVEIGVEDGASVMPDSLLFVLEPLEPAYV